MAVKVFMSYKGKFNPKNPRKYKGDFQNIIWRSLWERQIMVYLDETESVLEWSSEEIAIPYISPKDSRTHRYFPDFFVKSRNAAGEEKCFLWEIKPSKEAIEPAVKTREQLLAESASKKRKYYLDVIKYGINKRKWEAAEQYCKAKGWTFHIITEKHISSLTGSKIGRKKNK